MTATNSRLHYYGMNTTHINHLLLSPIENNLRKLAKRGRFLGHKPHSINMPRAATAAPQTYQVGGIVSETAHFMLTTMKHAVIHTK